MENLASTQFLQENYSLEDTLGNGLPSKEEEIRIKGRISAAEEQLQSFLRDKVRLKSAIDQLEAAEKHVQIYIAVQKGFDAPLKRLPDELLSKIFKEYAPSITIRGGEGPWRLLRVSRRWRSVALSISGLWSHIRIGHGKITAEDSLLILRRALSLSNNHPLYISCDLSKKENPRIVNMFVSCSNRWKHADISFGDLQESPTIFQIRNNVPILERLTIRGLECWKTFDLFKIAPKLTEVSLSYLMFGYLGEETPWSFVNLQLNWYQIRLLKLWTGLPFAAYADLLGSLTQLEMLYLRGLSLDVDNYPEILSEAPDGPRTFILPSVRQLFINGHTTDLHLAFLVLPELEEIQICIGHADYEHPDTLITAIQDLVSRSSCTVRKLMLCGRPDVSDSQRLFQLLPSLENLHLSIDADTPRNAILEALTLQENGDGSNCPLPNLQTLSFDHLCPSELLPLLDLIASRNSGIPAREPAFEGLLPFSSLDSLSGSSLFETPHEKASRPPPCVPIYNVLFVYNCDGWEDDLELMDEMREWHSAGYIRLNADWFGRPHSSWIDG